MKLIYRRSSTYGVILTIEETDLHQLCDKNNDLLEMKFLLEKALEEVTTKIKTDEKKKG